jgi:hypothetical protein
MWQVKIGYFRNFGRKTVFDPPLGQVGILSQNEKTSSTNFPHFQHKQNAKEILRKISLERKLKLIKKLVAILNFRRHFESDKKLFFYELCAI